MIRSWSNATTRRVAEPGKGKFPGIDAEAALDAATSVADLSSLRSVGLHRVQGDRKGQWAMTINRPWRICFRFRNGDAWDVETVDYH